MIAALYVDPVDFGASVSCTVPRCSASPEGGRKTCSRHLERQREMDRRARRRAGILPRKKKARQLSICSVCGGGAAGKYCSRKCAGAAVGLNGKARIRNPPSLLTCSQCGASWRTFHREQIFCSFACAAMGIRRTGARKDANHHEIVSALEAAGCSVLDMSEIGGGCPDIAVGFRGGTFLLEIKNRKTQYGRAGLNKYQVAWHKAWRGKVSIVTTPIEALEAVLGDGRVRIEAQPKGDR